MVVAVFQWNLSHPSEMPLSMMNNKPVQKNRSAHFRSAYMPSTARDMDPSGPQIARPGSKIMHHGEMRSVKMLNPMLTDTNV